MELTYKAYDQTGKAVEGTIESSDVLTASESLRGHGLFVTEIDTAASTLPPTRSFRIPLKMGGSQRIRSVAIFTRHQQ